MPKAKNGEPKKFLEWAILQETDECILWPYSTAGAGYASIHMSHGNREYVHRIICRRIHGPSPTPKHEATHLCGKGHIACINKRHLSWKTHKENIADKVVHGTARYGVRHHAAKLVEVDVLAIRAFAGIMTQQAIADKFGITSSNVRRIVTRKIWRHIA
jgi:hypothetical protein